MTQSDSSPNSDVLSVISQLVPIIRELADLKAQVNELKNDLPKDVIKTVARHEESFKNLDNWTKERRSEIISILEKERPSNYVHLQKDVNLLMRNFDTLLGNFRESSSFLNEMSKKQNVVATTVGMCVTRGEFEETIAAINRNLAVVKEIGERNHRSVERRMSELRKSVRKIEGFLRSGRWHE
jgi:hypothetical protein